MQTHQFVIKYMKHTAFDSMNFLCRITRNLGSNCNILPEDELPNRKKIWIA